MRSEQEMLDLILRTARNDHRIRAVILNGSRANPSAPHDIFQDYDIVYLVTDVDSFKGDLVWPQHFGEIMIMQLPEAMPDPPPENTGNWVYLMQFMDGNRIDLGLYPLTRVSDVIQDSLSVVLLDKDNIIPPLAPPSAVGYLPKPPTARQFSDCCNEFWWCSPYVAKGLWRQQITYAKAILDGAVRDQLMKMLAWYVGVQTGFSKNPGYLGKHLQERLEPELWDLLLKTYSDSDYARTWDALMATGSLFRRIAVPIAASFNFQYPFADDERVTAHLRHVRLLPRDATEMY